MNIVDLFLIAVGLSMDAFAVSICKGLGMRKINYQQALIIALFFGMFQAGMPLIGWALGFQFATFVSSFAHWIAFGLLLFIGGKMLWDAFHEDGEDNQDAASSTEKLDYKELVMLAIATSIDALAVGVTFAFLEVDIVPSISLIGVTTLAISFGGVIIGNRFGSKYERTATIIGGIVLILIGVKIVVGHFLGL